MQARPKVTWVYDVISPFAYLALPQVKALAAEVALQPLPVLFAGSPTASRSGGRSA